MKQGHIIPKSEMVAQELLKILPPEMIMSILSKLPVRTIIICRCVCKSLLHLVETQEFPKLHLSTSVPGLVTFQADSLSRFFNFFEVEDEHDVEHHDLHYNLVTKFNFPYAEWIHGSVDGLLWLSDRNVMADAIYICNPITRDYIRIRSPPKCQYNPNKWVTFGFGSCKMTGQYKVVWILLDKEFDNEYCYQVKSVAECYVYTLGAGSGWRRIARSALHCVPPKDYHPGAFVNGSLHWLGCDLEGCLWISCFDLETESCSTFFTAPPLRGAQRLHLLELFALGESLCLVDSTYEDEIVIWLMEEYGVAKSWTKKLVVNKELVGECHACKLRPLKVFKDGDILMGISDSMLFYYSSKTKTIQQVDMFKGNCRDTYNGGAISHTPSFLSLKSFGMENVSSF